MSKRTASGLLVLYDEAKGLAKPRVKVFSPSPQIERDVSAWIDAAEGIAVHRIDWVPSGGLLGASVLYSEDGRATEALRIVVPGLEGLERRIQRQKPIESFALFALSSGVVLGLVGLALFSLFYPETWNGEAGAIFDPANAVKFTVLVTGLGAILIFAGVAALFRARIT